MMNHKSCNVQQTKQCFECILFISSLHIPSSGSFLTRSCTVATVRGDAATYLRGSPPVISYLCLHLRQPASSPATSQPTSTSLLLGQRLSRGYFFCFSHLLSFILLSISSLLSLFHSLSFPLLSIFLLICLSTSLLTSVSLPSSPSFSHFFCLSHSPEDRQVSQMWKYLLTTNTPPPK